SKSIHDLKSHNFLGDATSNVTYINGGTSENIIPDNCMILIDRRTLPYETNQSVISEYTKIINNAINENEYNIENKTFVPSFLINKDHHLVKKMKQVTNKIEHKVKIKKFEATCEAPFFAIDKNIPTIIYGPGSLKEAHTSNEKVDKSQI